MPPNRSLLATALLVCAPLPWLVEHELHERVVDAVAGHMGAVAGLSLDAAGLRLEHVALERSGVRVDVARVHVRPAWDGIDVHLDDLRVERIASDSRDPEPPPKDSEGSSGEATIPRFDTHGLTVRVHAAGTTVLRHGEATVLLDAPTLTLGPDGVPRAAVGLTVQHPRGSVHSVGRLRAMPTESLRTWSVSGTVSIADGPPLRLRSTVDPARARVQLDHESGGWLQLGAWPDAQTASFEAHRFPLHGLGRLGRLEHGQLRLDLGAGTVHGRADLTPADDGALNVHLQGLSVHAVVIDHPKLSATAVTLGDTRLDGALKIRSVDDVDADVSLGHGPLALRARATVRSNRVALHLGLPDGPCQRLFDALPSGFADAMAGTEVEGSLAGSLDFSVDFDAARARAETLQRDPLADVAPPGTLAVEFPFRARCRVTRDPSAVDIPALRSPYRHRFIDAHGTPRSVLIANGAPHTVELGDVPLLAGAFVTLEDANYHRHHGLDIEQVANAVWHNLAAGEVQRGASTITQQAARNLFLGLDRSAARKLQEAFLATRIDSQVSKRRLLEIYLNIIELAPGIHGVEDAAQFYFGLRAADLSPLQATHLAMLAPAPRTYSERFRSGEIDDDWRTELHAQVRRMARHRVITRDQMLAALRGKLDLLDRR